MIPIITLNTAGCVVSVHDILSGDPAPLLDGAIQMRADWPALGSPEFGEKLRDWHAQNNNSAQLRGAVMIESRLGDRPQGKSNRRNHK